MDRLIYLTIVLALLVSCHKGADSPLDETPYLLEVPESWPLPDIPEDNELTIARVALGKRLFYDPVLSVDSTISCASCHKQELAFADDVAISPGVEGRLGFRNSPTLANVAYLTLVNKDGGIPKLDLQPVVPLEDDAEMDFSLIAAARRLNEIEGYEDDFLRAYDEAASPFTITRSLGTFMRTLISGDSKYDHYLEGKAQLTAAERAGMELFFSERTSCSSCHSSFNFTDNSFRNNGLYETYEDVGRKRVTILEEDEGKFRVPTLRNIALTAPYMHYGSLPDLAAVVEHYNEGGSNHPNKAPLIRPLDLSEQEQQQLVLFLEALTDSVFINNPEFR